MISIDTVETFSISEAETEDPGKEIHEFSNEAKMEIVDIKGSNHLKVSLLVGSDYF